MKLNHRLIHNEFHNKDVWKIIQELQQAACSNTKDTSISNLSDIMKTLLRIDYLEKYHKLDKQKVKLFNERIHHL
jgi:hypothetical protein